ncbi:MAG TPA: sucrase ferredoxin [Acidimicrobiales bacterium]|nr:sucrase ferredoxin [Acidimicrobiales bacterium]
MTSRDVMTGLVAGGGPGGGEPRWRCSAWARDVELDPGGTAPRVDVFVVVEHPLPWARDVGDDPLLAAVERAARAQVAGDRRVRLQAVAVDGASPARRVVVFAAGDGPFRGYGRLEAQGTPDQLPGIAAQLAAAEPPRPTAGGVTDVLVCTHGARDACCGSLGTRLWQGSEPSGVHLWRTSHTGGHRFAPTAVTFPDGAYWARLDPALLEGIVARRVPAEQAASHMRGCAAFGAAVQVADRAAFATRGWGWLATPRFGDERSAGRVELCFEAPGGDRGSVHVCLAPGRRMPVPDCGHDPATASKFETEWRAIRIETWR